MADESLYGAYFIATFGSALTCMFMFYLRMFACDLLCIAFLLCVFATTIAGAANFTAYGLSIGISFTFIMSLFIPWIIVINFKNAQSVSDNRIFQFIFSGMLCLSAAVMSRIQGSCGRTPKSVRSELSHFPEVLF